MMISLIMRIIMMIMKIVMMMTKIMMMTKTTMMMITTMMKITMMKMMKTMITEEEALDVEEVPAGVTSKETARANSLLEEEEDPDLDLVLAPDLAHQEEEDLLQVPETELQEEVLLP